MIRIKNAVDDQSKAHLRQAWASRSSRSDYDLEPVLDGRTIRLRTHIDITEQHYERVKHIVDVWAKKGIVSVIPLGPDGKPLNQLIPSTPVSQDGLTLEEWVKSGGPPESYAAVPVGEMHPFGFRVVDSAGLKNYLQDEKARKFVPDLTAPIQGIPADAIMLDEVQDLVQAEPEVVSVPNPVAEEIAKLSADFIKEELARPSTVSQLVTPVEIPTPTPVPPPPVPQSIDKKNKKKLF
jgi:hypothetical protein